MDQITKSIKYSLFQYVTLGFYFALFHTNQVLGEVNRLPVLRNAGVIPVQFEGSSDFSPSLKEQIADLFPEAVGESKRFRVLDGDLVKSLWSKPNGRSDLHNEYELDVYVALSIQQEDDVVNLLARLLDSDFKTILLESDRLPIYDVKRLDSAGLKKEIQALTFRLFNRLPQDVNVTSLQGSYVTLSGGQNQGIEAGDQIEISRLNVAAVHPANGSWIEFDSRKLGAIKIVDAKDSTSIARIIRQTNPRAIEVGDGAKIPTIPSRVLFARLADSATFQDSGTQSSIVLPPIPQVSSPQSPSKQLIDRASSSSNVTQSDSNRDTNAIGSTPSTPLGDKKNLDSEKPLTQKMTEYSDSMQSAWSDFSDEAMRHKLIDEWVFYAGPAWWGISGPASSSGRFPWWLLNNAGIGITRTMFYKIRAGFGGSALFGNTPDGSYFGYEGYGRIFWESPLQLPALKIWRAGAQTNLTGLSLTSGGLGGGDFVRGGVFGGLGGFFTVGESAHPFEWTSNLYLFPLNIGRMGYSGTFKEVESALGWKIDVSVFEKNPSQPYDIGGGIVWGDERQTMKNGRRFHVEDYQVKAMLRYQM